MAPNPQNLGALFPRSFKRTGAILPYLPHITTHATLDNKPPPPATDGCNTILSTEGRPMPHTRTKAKTKKRSPGWIGIRVTVCGYQLHTDLGDLVCLLPPNHPQKIPHSSMAVDTNEPIMVIEHDDHITLVESPNNHGKG